MKYRSKPTDCEAMQWCRCGPGDASCDLRGSSWDKIVNWVNTNGGEARYEPATDNWYTSSPREFHQHPARIAVRTINGWAYAAPGHYVVMGSATFETFDYVFQGCERTRPCRDFYPCDPETFERRWEDPLAAQPEAGER